LASSLASVLGEADAGTIEMALSRIDTHHHLFAPKYLAAINVFGSDFPYVHGDVLDFEIKELDQLDVFEGDAREAMTRTNALSLFPRFANENT
jgi:predicted TIM-barrel fold metal-dependent hydrolase